MVNKNFLIIGVVVAIIAIILIARSQKAYASTDIVDVNEQTGGIENAIADVGQTELGVPIDFGLQGILGSANVAGDSQQAQQKILAGDYLLGEDAIRAIETKLNSVFDSVAGDKGGVLINTQQAANVSSEGTNSITDPAPKRGTLTITGESAPLGNAIQDGQVIAGIRGKPLAPRAISQTQPTIEGVLTTTAGGERQIAGSQRLFDRLKSNLAG